MDIADGIAREADIPRVTALKATDVIIEEMTIALSRGERIEFRGFGVFEKVLRKKSVARDIQKGTVIDVPASYTIKYKAGSEISIGKKG